MAQGSRKRAIWLAAGVLLCGGVTGCMDHDKKPISPPPAARGTTTAPPGATSQMRAPGTNGMGNTVTGPGVLPASYNQQNNGYGPAPAGQTRTAGPTFSGTPNSSNFGAIGAPTTPGVAGPGGPMPNMSAVPSVTPPGTQSNYPPAYPQAPAYPQPPAGHSYSQPGAGPTSAVPLSPGIAADPRAVRSAMPTNDPQPPKLDNLAPPPPPIRSVVPSTEPLPGPIAPPIAPTEAMPYTVK